ncbi:MAG: hypothetical protein MZV63_13525 [Marinilabiliales bacterium]|nr:hypothetical protein [Marinilabiliales bacterium]
MIPTRSGRNPDRARSSLLSKRMSRILTSWSGTRGAEIFELQGLVVIGSQKIPVQRRLNKEDLHRSWDL